MRSKQTQTRFKQTQTCAHVLVCVVAHRALRVLPVHRRGGRVGALLVERGGERLVAGDRRQERHDRNLVGRTQRHVFAGCHSNFNPFSLVIELCSFETSRPKNLEMTRGVIPFAPHLIHDVTLSKKTAHNTTLKGKYRRLEIHSLFRVVSPLKAIEG